MHFYNDWGQRILHGELSGHLAFYGLPGYPYLLAFLYKIFSYNPFIPALFQALLDSGTALLIYRIALRVFPDQPPAEVDVPAGARRVIIGKAKLSAVLAALGWAAFVPAQAYSAILMPTAWMTFAFWLVVWWTIRHEANLRPKECLFLGLLIGLTATAVATVLFLIPLVLAALFIKPRIGQSKRPLLLGAGLLFFGVLAGTSPCWIHNYLVARDPVFLSAHSGINFWIGNNPEANGYPRFPPGLRAGQAAMLEDSINSAESAAGRPLKRSEVSAYWSEKATSYITHHFRDWLWLLLKKLRNFWNAFQYDDLSIITSLREQGIIFPGLYFGVIAAIALPGMLLSWRFAPRSRWITAAILLHMCALLPVFVTERYRLPIVPGLLIFAALGLSIFWHGCEARNFRLAALYLALLAVSLSFVSRPERNASLWAVDPYNSGCQALESNNLPLAEKKLDLARAYVPQSAEVNFAFGNLRLAQKQRDAAIAFYRSALAIDPRHKGALNNLGVIAFDANDLPTARDFFNRALAVDPRHAKTHYLLARTAARGADLVTAKTEIAKAIALNRDQPEFRAFERELIAGQPAQ